MYLPYLYMLVFINPSYIDFGFHSQILVNLYLCGYEKTKIQFQLPWNDDVQSINLAKDHNFHLELNYTLGYAQWELLRKFGIPVRSDYPLTVEVSCGHSTEPPWYTYTAMPLTSKSKDFYLAAFSTILSGFSHVLLMAAGHQSSKVSVYSPQGESTSHILQPYQVVTYITDIDDITGFYIESSKPVVVFTGLVCTNQTAGCGHSFFLQVPPTYTLGDGGLAGAFKGLPHVAMLHFRSVIIHPETEIKLTYSDTNVQLVNDSNVHCNMSKDNSGDWIVECDQTLNRGMFIEFQVNNCSSTVAIQCSKPCLLMQYLKSNTSSKHVSYQHMGLVPSVDLPYGEIKFHIPDSLIGTNLTNNMIIILRKQYIEHLWLNGLNIKNRTFKSISDINEYAVVTVFDMASGYYEVELQYKHEKISVVVYSTLNSENCCDVTGFQAHYVDKNKAGVLPPHPPVLESPTETAVFACMVAVLVGFYVAIVTISCMVSGKNPEPSLDYQIIPDSHTDGGTNTPENDDLSSTGSSVSLYHSVQA